MTHTKNKNRFCKGTIGNAKNIKDGKILKDENNVGGCLTEAPEETTYSLSEAVRTIEACGWKVTNSTIKTYSPKFVIGMLLLGLFLGAVITENILATLVVFHY